MADPNEKDDEGFQTVTRQKKPKPRGYQSETAGLARDLQRLRVADSRGNQMSMRPRGHMNWNGASQSDRGSAASARSNDVAHAAASATPTTAPGRLDKYEFNRWMNSRDSKESLWSDEKYCSCLLSYIGSIYGQKGKIYKALESLRIQMNKSEELYQLNEIVKRLKEQPGAEESFKQWKEERRASHRLEDLQVLFEYADLPPSILNKWDIDRAVGFKEIVNTQSIHAYYDLICRDGLITAEVGKYLQLSKEDILGGTDYESHNDDITFVQTDLQQSTIDLRTNRVDLITCLVTLHHVPNLEEMLLELTRILRPGGYLIIREHDCKKEFSLRMKYLNFIHAFMMIARIGEFAHLSASDGHLAETTSTDWNQLKREIIANTSEIQYHTREQWNQMLGNVGFQWKATMKYAQSRNPQALYYAVYQLQSKILD